MVMPSADVVCFLKADSDVMENDAMEDLSKPGAAGGGNNVLSGLALCLLEDGVCFVCVCVCVCVRACVCVCVCVVVTYFYFLVNILCSVFCM